MRILPGDPRARLSVKTERRAAARDGRRRAPRRPRAVLHDRDRRRGAVDDARAAGGGRHARAAQGAPAGGLSLASEFVSSHGQSLDISSNFFKRHQLANAS